LRADEHACNLTPGNTYTINYTITFTPACNGVSSVSGSTTLFTPASTTTTVAASQMYGPLTCSSTSACLQATISSPQQGSNGPFTFNNLCNITLNCIPVAVCDCTRPGGGATSTSIISELGATGPGNFTVLSLGGNGAVININLATVTGNVGAQNSTKVMESAPSTVTGDFVVGSSANTSGIKGSHGPIVVDDSLLAQAVSDAETAAADFANLTPTLPASAFNNGNINGNVTLQGANGAVNVVDLPQLSVPNGTLTLVGTAGTSFVINIAGNFNLHSGKIVVSGGMGPLDVVYNACSHSFVF
jgi:hypothetical protein